MVVKPNVNLLIRRDFADFALNERVVESLERGPPHTLQALPERMLYRSLLENDSDKFSSASLAAYSSIMNLILRY